MSVPIFLFLAIVIASSAVIVTSIALFVQVLSRVHSRWPKRLAMAIVLPWGAAEAWRRRRRALATAWMVSIALYAGLRATAAYVV
jgi:hypothetical protein